MENRKSYQRNVTAINNPRTHSFRGYVRTLNLRQNFVSFHNVVYVRTKITTQVNPFWNYAIRSSNEILKINHIPDGCCVTVMEGSLRFDFHGNIFVVERRLVLIVERFSIKLGAMFW